VLVAAGEVALVQRGYVSAFDSHRATITRRSAGRHACGV
jgi:hypothetical protein